MVYCCMLVLWYNPVWGINGHCPAASNIKTPFDDFGKTKVIPRNFPNHPPHSQLPQALQNRSNCCWSLDLLSDQVISARQAWQRRGEKRKRRREAHSERERERERENERVRESDWGREEILIERSPLDNEFPPPFKCIWGNAWVIHYRRFRSVTMALRNEWCYLSADFYFADPPYPPGLCTSIN